MHHHVKLVANSKITHCNEFTYFTYLMLITVISLHVYMFLRLLPPAVLTAQYQILNLSFSFSASRVHNNIKIETIKITCLSEFVRAALSSLFYIMYSWLCSSQMALHPLTNTFSLYTTWFVNTLVAHVYKSDNTSP